MYRLMLYDARMHTVPALYIFLNANTSMHTCSARIISYYDNYVYLIGYLSVSAMVSGQFPTHEDGRFTGCESGARPCAFCRLMPMPSGVMIGAKGHADIAGLEPVQS